MLQACAGAGDALRGEHWLCQMVRVSSQIILLNARTLSHGPQELDWVSPTVDHMLSIQVVCRDIILTLNPEP